MVLHSEGMSLRAKRTCPVCQTKFDPIVEWQVCDTRKCTNVLNVRRFRARKRNGGDDGGGPHGRRAQLGLFPKPPAKAPKLAPVPEPMLFPTSDGSALVATFGGAAEYRQDGSVSDKNRYYVQ